MSSEADDLALLRALRRTWETVDPAPTDLADRMVAVVAAADLSHEYALLTLVDDAARTAVRGDADAATLQFSDGTTNVLVHVTAAADGRRLDGWVDAPARAVFLLHPDAESSTIPDGGRFSFAQVPAGLVRLRIELETPADAAGPVELLTPRFEL